MKICNRISALTIFLISLLCGITASAAPREYLHVVYVTNRDRAPLPDYTNRLHRIMVDVQDFYKTEMQRNGYGPVTFKLDTDKSGRTRVHLVTLDWDFDKTRPFTPKELRPVIAATLEKAGIDIEQEYFITFENAYWKEGDTYKYDVVYTGSGNPVKGATWVADHQLLDAGNFDPALKEIINDRGQKLTTGEFNVKMIGGVAHELGHALGLPHNRQTRDEHEKLGTALMGSGNYTYRQERLGKRTRGSFLTQAHAFILSLHPLFTGQTPDSFEIPNVFIENLTLKIEENNLIVYGQAMPADHVAGVVLYHDPLPTGVNKDYDAFSYLAEMGRENWFRTSIPLRESTEGCALHIIVYSKNGMHRKFSFTRDNAPDKGLKSISDGYLKARAEHAFALRDAETLSALIPELEALDPKEAKAAELFLRISKQWQGFNLPADVPATMASISLSETRWSHAAVGWYVPSFNGVLEPGGRFYMPLHSSKGPCKKGLYAHADSNYKYALGAKWASLKGRIAIQKGHSEGSVIFAIKGDGRELFRSKLVKLGDGEVPFDIALTGIKQLELITESGPDGKNGDWGIWIDPILER